MNSESLKLMHNAITEWNTVADNKIKGRNQMNQIRAFIIGRGENCSIDDIHEFICQELLD